MIIEMLLVAVLVQTNVAAAPEASAQEVTAMEEAAVDTKSKVEVSFRHSKVGKRLKVDYSIINRAGVPIFVFDRFWDRRRKTLDVDQSSIDIVGSKAVIRRALLPMPDNVLVEHPDAALGREVAPGETATGSFQVSLPLEQSDPYGINEGERRPTDIDSLQLAIGWCPSSDLKDQVAEVTAKKSGDEKLWPFSFYNIQVAQKIAISAAMPVNFAGKAFGRR